MQLLCSRGPLFPSMAAHPFRYQGAKQKQIMWTRGGRAEDGLPPLVFVRPAGGTHSEVQVLYGSW